MLLKDYIHYYIGCRVQHEFITKTKNVELRYGILMGLHTSEIINRCYLQFDSYSDSVRFDSIKPILRKLEDALPEEIGEMRLIRDSITNRIEKYAAVTKYLTSIGIDVFGLIKSGLAIDSKTLK